jgi:CBS-domain-containing membrane protein
MKKITKPILTKAIIAGFFSSLIIGVLTLLTYKTTLGLFLTASFGSSMVLLFGYPESPFAQPKNVFFGHLITALVGVIFVNFIPLPIFINIPIAVGIGIFLMIILDITHPPAGGNPIIVIIASTSYEYLISPMIFGSLIIILLAIFINKLILKKNYPLK